MSDAADATTPVPALDAATVVVARNGSKGPEVLLLQRHGRSAFLANASVYPGGKVDPQDADPALHARLSGVRGGTLRELGATGATETGALALLAAALRESFEEAGVLPAHRASRATLDFADAAVRERFAEYREAVHSGRVSLLDVIEREDLLLEAGALNLFAHWITPVIESRRFDTRFFALELPAGQEPLHDSRETVASRWLTPAGALRAYAAGEIQLAPPTYCTLRTMAGARDVESLIDRLTAEPLVPILPRFETVEGEGALLMPGDPLYPSDRPAGPPRRLWLRDGQWIPETSE